MFKDTKKTTTFTNLNPKNAAVVSAGENLLPDVRLAEPTEVNHVIIGHESTVLGDIAHASANVIGTASNGLHAVGKHMPGVLHKFEECAEIAAEIFHNHSTQDPVENIVCGTLSGVAKVGVGACAVAGLAFAPAIEIPLIAGTGVLTAATLEAATAGTIGAAAQHAVNAVTQPVGEAVKTACHAAFDYCKGDKTPIKPSVEVQEEGPACTIENDFVMIEKPAEISENQYTPKSNPAKSFFEGKPHGQQSDVRLTQTPTNDSQASLANTTSSSLSPSKASTAVATKKAAPAPQHVVNQQATTRINEEQRRAEQARDARIAQGDAETARLNHDSVAIHEMNNLAARTAQAYPADAEVLNLYTAYQQSALTGKARGEAFAQFYQKVQSHFAEERLINDGINLSVVSSQFCSELSQATKSPQVRAMGKGISAMTQSFAGIKQVADTSSLIVAGGGTLLANAAGLMGGAGMVLSAYNIMSSIFADEEEVDDSLNQAIAALHYAVIAMWSDVAKRFEETWRRLDHIDMKLTEMEKNAVKRFAATLRVINYYSQKTLTQLKALDKSLHGRLDYNQQVLESYLHELSDTEAINIISMIDKSQTKAVENLLPHSTKLKTWLTKTAAVSGRSGYIRQSESLPIDPKTRLQQLQRVTDSLSPSAIPVGFFGSLAESSLDTGILSKTILAELINTQDWPQVLSCYLKLMTWGLPAIYQGEQGEASQYLQDVEAIKRVPYLVTELLTNCYSKKFLKSLVKEYQQAVLSVHTQIKTVLEEQRQELNRRYELNPMLEIVRLEETTAQNIARIEQNPSIRKQIGQSDAKSFLSKQPIPAANCADASLNDSIEMFGFSPAQSLPTIRYLNEQQIEKLLSDPEAHQRIKDLLLNVGFNVSAAFKLSSLPIRCYAEDLGGSGSRFHIAFGLEHQGKTISFYDLGVIAYHFPDGAQAFDVCGNVLPNLHALAGFNAWNNGTPFNATLHTSSTQLPKEYDDFKTSSFATAIEESILKPARKIAASELMKRIDLTQFELARLKLLLFMKLFNPSLAINLQQSTERVTSAFEELQRTGRIGPLASLLQLKCWEGELIRYDLKSIDPLPETRPGSSACCLDVIWEIVQNKPLNDLRLWQEMMDASVKLEALAVQLQPDAVARQRQLLTASVQSTAVSKPSSIPVANIVATTADEGDGEETDTEDADLLEQKTQKFLTDGDDDTNIDVQERRWVKPESSSHQAGVRLLPPHHMNATQRLTFFRQLKKENYDVSQQKVYDKTCLKVQLATITK